MKILFVLAFAASTVCEYRHAPARVYHGAVPSHSAAHGTYGTSHRTYGTGHHTYGTAHRAYGATVPKYSTVPTYGRAHHPTYGTGSSYGGAAATIIHRQPIQPVVHHQPVIHQPVVNHPSKQQVHHSVQPVVHQPVQHVVHQPVQPVVHQPVQPAVQDPVVHQSVGVSDYHFSWRHDGGIKYPWDAAIAHCQSLGAGWHGVSIETHEEDRFISSIIASEQLEYIWTGGHKIGGSFVWPSNAKFIGLNWSHTGLNGDPQPDNRENGQETSLAILNNVYEDGITWHDVAPHHQKPIICERRRNVHG